MNVCMRYHVGRHTEASKDCEGAHMAVWARKGAWKFLPSSSSLPSFHLAIPSGR